MRTFIRAALASMIGMAFFVGPVSAATISAITVAQAAGTGTITGRVVADSGGAVSTASVTILGGGQRQTITTDDSGNFTATLPPGIYTVSVAKAGFQSGSNDVTVTADTSVSISITLTAASLNNLNVIGRTSSSNAGNAAKFNISPTTIQTLTQAQITARNTPDLSQLVNELPGITIPHFSSNPNQSFVLRGFRLETNTTLDGHPVSSGTGGAFLTNYASAGIFGGVDVLKGGGLDGPISGESGVGIVNLRTPDFAGKNTGSILGGLDNYGGTFFTALADVNLTPKLELIAGKSFSGYRGNDYGQIEPATYGPNSYYSASSVVPAVGTFSVPTLTNGLVEYVADMSDTYSLEAELAKLRYKFSDSTSLAVEFLGLQGQFNPQGGAYGQIYGAETLPYCVNGATKVPSATAAGCGPTSSYNSPAAAGLIGTQIPLYVFYPGSQVSQTQPNWNADFHTTIGNDTLLVRPYSSTITRDINGTQENATPGDDNTPWYQVTSNANCQAASSGLGTVAAMGPCYSANAAPNVAYLNAPGSTVFPYTTSTLPNGGLGCAPANPCYTTGTIQQNSGQYGFGSPYTTLEIDKLFGYTFSYLHPFGNNTLNLTVDHYYDYTLSYQGDFSPPAPGCQLTVAGTPNTVAAAGVLGYQPTCPLATLHASNFTVPPTFDSRTSIGLSGVFQLIPKLELDAGVYYTKYLINGQGPNPTIFNIANLVANYAGSAGGVPLNGSTISGYQNAGSHIDPRLGLAFQATNDLVFRFSAGSSEEIPYSSLVSGFTTYTSAAGNETAVQKNYGLLPEEIVQEDLGMDYRFPDGGVFSADLYNMVVHNPWLSVTLPVCTGAACTAPGGPFYGFNNIANGFTSSTFNASQQYAEGIEVGIMDEPRVGLGYRVESSFERDYYLYVPNSFYGATSFQYFYNGAQYTSTGSPNVSVPYAKAYGELQWQDANKSLVRIGVDYEGNNNSYNAPAFVIFDMGIKFNTGFHNVMLNITGENLFATTFNAQLAKGVQYQGLSSVLARPAVGGYTYAVSTTSTTPPLVSPGPPTFRFSLSKQF